MTYSPLTPDGYISTPPIVLLDKPTLLTSLPSIRETSAETLFPETLLFSNDRESPT